MSGPRARACLHNRPCTCAAHLMGIPATRRVQRRKRRENGVSTQSCHNPRQVLFGNLPTSCESTVDAGRTAAANRRHKQVHHVMPPVTVLAERLQLLCTCAAVLPLTSLCLQHPVDAAVVWRIVVLTVALEPVHLTAGNECQQSWQQHSSDAAGIALQLWSVLLPALLSGHAVGVLCDWEGVRTYSSAHTARTRTWCTVHQRAHTITSTRTWYSTRLISLITLSG